MFCFRPGHEPYPIYYRDEIRRVLANAVESAAPPDGPTPHFEAVDAAERTE